MHRQAPSSSNTALNFEQKKLRDLIRTTGLFVILVFAFENSLLILLHQTSTIDLLAIGFSKNVASDSWWPMRAAFDWLSAHAPGSLLYQDVFFKQGIKFLYSPTSLLPFLLAGHFGIPFSNVLLNRLGEAITIVDAGSVGALAWLMASRIDSLTRNYRLLAACALVGAFSCITFHPVVNALARGQIQTWINTAFALSCVCWFLDRKVLAGILIGGICLLKPQFGLFLIWGGLRREWAFLLGWAAVVLLGLGFSIYEFGLANHLDYVNFLSYMGHRGEPGFDNQSINGLLNRWTLSGDDLEWHEHAFAPYNPIVAMGTLMTSCVLVALSLFWHRLGARATFADFLTAALTFTIASPIAWEDHYGILSPIFLFLFFALLSEPPSKTRWGLLFTLAMALALVANRIPFAHDLSRTPARLLTSYLFFGALIVLGLLYRIKWRGRLRTPVQSPLTKDKELEQPIVSVV